MKHLYVVTHTEATHHLARLVGGGHDSELTARGRRHAARIADHLRGLIPEDAPTEIFASDLRRAAQTAQPIADRLHIPIQTTPDLREISYGEAEGQPQAWLDARYIHPPRGGARLDHDVGIPDAETRRAFATRIYGVMDRILASDCSYQVIVTHGFALTFVVAAWIGLPLESAGLIAVASTPGGITHLHQDDVFHNRTIVRVNDTSHLDEAAP